MRSAASNGSSSYAANSQIYLRAIGDLEARPLTRAGASLNFGPQQLVFSRDGRSISYIEFAQDQAFLLENGKTGIKRIEVTGGAPVTVAADVASDVVLEWRGDSIFFSTPPVGGPGSIMRVAASGAQPERIIQLERGEQAARPQVLDDGRVLFAVGPSRGTAPIDWSAGRIVVQRPGEKTRTTIVEGGTDPRYLSSGHLIYQ